MRHLASQPHQLMRSFRTVVQVTFEDLISLQTSLSIDQTSLHIRSACVMSSLGLSYQSLYTGEVGEKFSSTQHLPSSSHCPSLWYLNSFQAGADLHVMCFFDRLNVKSPASLLKGTNKSLKNCQKFYSPSTLSSPPLLTVSAGLAFLPGLLKQNPGILGCWPSSFCSLLHCLALYDSSLSLTHLATPKPLPQSRGTPPLGYRHGKHHGSQRSPFSNPFFLHIQS